MFLTPMYSKRLFRAFGPRVAIASGSICLGSEFRSNRWVSAAAANPLLQQDGLPKFAQIESSHVEPAINECLASAKTNFAAIESVIKKGTFLPQSLQVLMYAIDSIASYDIVEKLEKLQAPLSYSWGVVGHLMGVKNSDSLRKAHEAVQPAVVRFNQELGQNQALFNCLQSIKANEAIWSSLDEAQHRIVDCAIRDMTKSGVGLSDAMRPLFNEFQLEVSELSTKFSNNVLDSTKAFKLTLTDPSDMDGLPPSAKALLSKQAVSNGFEKASARHRLLHMLICVD